MTPSPIRWQPRLSRSVSSIPVACCWFPRLRQMKPGAMSQSRRLNRKQANQLKGKIRDGAQEKAYAVGVVSCEVNAHGTSQYCCRCGARGERFSRSGQSCTVHRGGKLFRCPVCGYEAQADFNASVNVHHSFWKEWHWQPRKKPSPKKRIAGEERRPVRLKVGWEKDGEGKPADPSQARAANEQTWKVMGLLLDQRGHDSDGEATRRETSFLTCSV